MTTGSRTRFLGGLRIVFAITLALIGLTVATVRGADTWIEVKGAHVTVLANGGAGDARNLAWQLEQIRSAATKTYPWIRADLDRPFLVMAVDSEQKMRSLVPGYWERSSKVRPESVWVSGSDKHYLAIRSDVKAEDRRNLNPHVNAYFSYVSLFLQQSLQGDMPLWFIRGFAGVLSNTIVREAFVNIGAPIPWHLQSLRSGPRLLTRELIAVTPDSRELKTGDGLAGFDAQSWAFVHLLMFGDNGARRPKLNEFLKLVSDGGAADRAFAQAFGSVDQLELDFVNYLRRDVFSFAQLPLDASVKREGFAQRTLSPVEAASALALFHTAMQRPGEARAAIAEARKSGAAAPDCDVAEGLLLSQENKADEARAALERAIANGTTNAYAYYAVARMQWRGDPDQAALVGLEKLLSRAAELNPQHAWPIAMLAEVRSQLGSAEALEVIAQAIKLAPSEPEHRLTAARILWREGRRDDALKAVAAAMTVARDEAARARARQLQELIERQKP